MAEGERRRRKEGRRKEKVEGRKWFLHEKLVVFE